MNSKTIVRTIASVLALMLMTLPLSSLAAVNKIPTNSISDVGVEFNLSELGIVLHKVEYTKSTDVSDGDVDCDGRTTVADAILVARYALSLTELSSEQIAHADVDSSGSVTVADAIIIARLALGLSGEEQPKLVPINELENLRSLKCKCTDAEFQEAYDAAAEIVTPLLGLSVEDQLIEIARYLRWMLDSGQVEYSTSAPHYNDPYGYLILGVASCAGCTRTTGLCLNMLGISYEHVNENQWSHQWCRVNIDGVYWICDAYGLYVGPEPSPYGHPFFW